MQNRKLKIALSLGTIILASASLTACQNNPFSAEKAAEPAKADDKAATTAVKPADGKCGAAKAEGKCGANMDGKCGATKPAAPAATDTKAATPTATKAATEVKAK